MGGGARDEDGAKDVGALEQLGGRSFESHLALLHEDRPFRQLQGDVHRLLDDDDRRSPAVDLAHHVEELADNRGCKAEGELVDHHQLGPGHQGHPEGQHLLLAAGQVARHLGAPLLQHGEEIEHLAARLVDALLLVGDQPGGQLEVLRDAERREDALPAGHQ